MTPTLHLHTKSGMTHLVDDKRPASSREDTPCLIYHQDFIRTRNLSRSVYVHCVSLFARSRWHEFSRQSHKILAGKHIEYMSRFDWKCKSIRTFSGFFSSDCHERKGNRFDITVTHKAITLIKRGQLELVWKRDWLQIKWETLAHDFVGEYTGLFC